MGLGALVIEVVLPTFNGAAYLAEQVASIHQQTLRPQRLLVRDDGSSDGTQALLAELRQHYGSWLHWLPCETNLGCSANVNRLLEATEAPYVALADQDDVWLPHKLEASLALLQQVERRHGIETPMIVHSDLELIDAAGLLLGKTFIQSARLDPLRTDPKNLALTNVVTGCTVLLNRMLLQKALPIPGEAMMHDWWLALVASCFGQIVFLPDPTVLYRQHGGNVLGAKGIGPGYCIKRLQHFSTNPSAGGHTRAAIRQADCFEQRYGHQLSALPALLQLPRRRRWLALLKLSDQQRPSKHGPLRTLGLYGLLAWLPR